MEISVVGLIAAAVQSCGSVEDGRSEGALGPRGGASRIRCSFFLLRVAGRVGEAQNKPFRSRASPMHKGQQLRSTRANIMDHPVALGRDGGRE
jgi:hypothetical protein